VSREDMKAIYLTQQIYLKDDVKQEKLTIKQ